MRIFVFIFSLFLAGPAQACAIYKGTDFRDVLMADAIIVGPVRNYKLTDGKKLAILLIEPVEVLTGDISTHLDDRGLIEAKWINSTFNLPDQSSFSRARPPYFVIALNMTALKGFEGGDVPSIMQRPCSGPLVFSGAGPVGVMLRQVFQAPEQDREKILNDLLIFAERTRAPIGQPMYFPNRPPRRDAPKPD